MDEQLYLVMIRKGMTGGTNRSVYKMLASSDDWENHLAEGDIQFFAGGIPVCHITWGTIEASSEEEAFPELKRQAVKANGSDWFIISYAEALRIDRGEEVNESPGSISAESIKLIQEKGDKSQFIEMSKEELERQIKKDKKNES
jgi:hypothetical protein